VRHLAVALVVLLAAGCAGVRSGTGETAAPLADAGLPYVVNRAVHDTLAVFVDEARRNDPHRPLYFVWRVYGVDERGITVEAGPQERCDSVLVARSGRSLVVNGERFPLALGDDYFAVYDSAMRPPHPGLGPAPLPEPRTGCWVGSEFPMAVRFHLGGEITETGQVGVVPKRYVNPRYVGAREGR
jgi:hypothetical protein